MRKVCFLPLWERATRRFNTEEGVRGASANAPHHSSYGTACAPLLQPKSDYSTLSKLRIAELDDPRSDGRGDIHRRRRKLTASLAFPPAPPDIGAGGWRWTSHSPTGSGPEGSSPNERGSGRSSASHTFSSLQLRGPALERQ